MKQSMNSSPRWSSSLIMQRCVITLKSVMKEWKRWNDRRKASSEAFFGLPDSLKKTYRASVHRLVWDQHSFRTSGRRYPRCSSGATFPACRTFEVFHWNSIGPSLHETDRKHMKGEPLDKVSWAYRRQFEGIILFLSLQLKVTIPLWLSTMALIDLPHCVHICQYSQGPVEALPGAFWKPPPGSLHEASY